MNKISLRNIVDHLKSKGILARLIGDSDCYIYRLATLQEADTTSLAGGISFLSNPKYRQYLSTTTVSAVILKEIDASFYEGNRIVTDNPHLAWAYTSQLFDVAPKKKAGIHPTAVISDSATIATTASIGAFAVIEENVVIAENVVIGAHCVIENSVTIGENSFLYPRVTICYDCHLGKNVVLHPGAVIGSQGFGFAKGSDGFVSIAQVGRVILDDYVDIGANTCIDRGAIEDTHLKRDTRIDNLVQIAHNVVIGEHSVMAGCAGVAGSTTIGNNVMIGGGTCVNGHINITDNVMVTGFTMLTHSIKAPGVYSSGLPMMENQEWHRVISKIKKLDQLFTRVKILESQENLERFNNN